MLMRLMKNNAQATMTWRSSADNSNLYTFKLFLKIRNKKKRYANMDKKISLQWGVFNNRIVPAAYKVSNYAGCLWLAHERCAKNKWRQTTKYSRIVNQNSSNRSATNRFMFNEY